MEEMLLRARVRLPGSVVGFAHRFVNICDV